MRQIEAQRDGLERSAISGDVPRVPAQVATSPEDPLCIAFWRRCERFPTQRDIGGSEKLLDLSNPAKKRARVRRYGPRYRLGCRTVSGTPTKSNLARTLSAVLDIHN